mgnify:CR=1 FL=1
MDVFKKIIKYLITKLNSFLDIFYKINIKDGEYYLDYNLKSYAQWESKQLVRDIIREKIDTSRDPGWQKSGAKTREEYKMYSWQICGMACLKMILKSIYPEKRYKLVHLAKEAQKYGVYKKKNISDITANLDGLFPYPFIQFIKKYNLKGHRKIGVKENYLAKLILKNKFIIASVHHTIREDNPPQNTKRGHLVLIVGFKVKNKKVLGFYVNNPSGYYKISQEKHFVSLKNWRKCFIGNCIIIEKK